MIVIVSDWKARHISKCETQNPQKSTYSSCRVGDAVEGHGGSIWADGGEDADGRGDPGLVGPGGDRCGEASNNGELCELHFD